MKLDSFDGHRKRNFHNYNLIIPWIQIFSFPLCLQLSMVLSENEEIVSCNNIYNYHQSVFHIWCTNIFTHRFFSLISLRNFCGSVVCHLFRTTSYLSFENFLACFGVLAFLYTLSSYLKDLALSPPLTQN